MIGAGLAGLATAWELVKGGAEVVLYEERAEPGGRMRSDTLDGYVVDPGVQLVSSTHGSLFRLAEEIGARSWFVRSPGRDALWRNGRAHTLTYGSVASLATSTALPAWLKLRLAAKYLPYLAGHARRLDANDPARTGGAELDGHSVAEWGREELGDDFVELLAYPLLATYYGGPPERISVALYHALAKVGTDVKLYALKEGMGTFARRVLGALRERGVHWRGGEAVTGVRMQGAHIRVESASGAETYDAAVLAVPARVSLTLLEGDAALVSWLGKVESAPTATLALLLDRPLDVDYFGLSFPRGTSPGEVVVALCMQHRKIAGLVPGGRALVVAYPAPKIAPEMANASSAEVVERLLPAIEQVFRGVRAQIIHARAYRFPEGYTLFYPGYLRHILMFDEAWLPPGLALAGDYLVAPTAEGAVISGQRAAMRLLKQRQGR